jgi:hypothetical protein
MSEIKHTPTPWRADDEFGHIAIRPVNEKLEIINSDLQMEHSELLVLWDYDNCQEDAEFIVRACNSHDGLVEAARCAYKVLAYCIAYSHEHSQATITAAREQLRDVLQEALPGTVGQRSTPVAAQVCERCTMRTQTTTGSFFNTEQICSDCEAEEKAHPKYQEATSAEYSAVKSGDLNFKGIGLPGELRQQALKRAGDETSGRR